MEMMSHKWFNPIFEDFDRNEDEDDIDNDDEGNKENL